MHRAWLAEYNQLGYPQQCRNVATSGGSECGRPQAFAPGANLLNIQGTGLLDDTYSSLINGSNFFLGAGTGLLTGGILSLFAGTGVGAIAIAVGYGVGAILALGNYEGHVDFVVNALPNQQQLPIYHGRLGIYKDVVFGLFTTHFLNYADDNNSFSYMLPYDSAPGGIYDINQLSRGALNQISSAIPIAGTRSYVQPTFCFVPTTSALDIGGGNVALGTQDLTASYVNTAPPAAPLNTPFANFITAGRQNLTHILWNGLNSKWAFQEMQTAPQNVNCLAFCQANPTISGPSAVCSSGATYSIPNLPPGTTVNWQLVTDTQVSQTSGTGPTFMFSFTGTSTGTSGVLTATLQNDCGNLSLRLPIYVGTPETPGIGALDTFDGCTYQFATFQIFNYDPTLSYQLSASGSISLRSQLRADGTFNVKGGGRGGAITITATNSCGTTTIRNDFTFEPCSNFAVYPNPGADEVTVQQDDTTTPTPSARAAADAPGARAAADPSPGIEAVRLYDNYGQLRLEQAGHGARAVRLRVGALPAGFYVLHIVQEEGAVVSRQRLEVAH